MPTEVGLRRPQVMFPTPGKGATLYMSRTQRHSPFMQPSHRGRTGHTVIPQLCLQGLTRPQSTLITSQFTACSSRQVTWYPGLGVRLGDFQVRVTRHMHLSKPLDDLGSVHLTIQERNERHVDI